MDYKFTPGDPMLDTSNPAPRLQLNNLTSNNWIYSGFPQMLFSLKKLVFDNLAPIQFTVGRVHEWILKVSMVQIMHLSVFQGTAIMEYGYYFLMLCDQPYICGYYQETSLDPSLPSSITVRDTSTPQSKFIIIISDQAKFNDHIFTPIQELSNVPRILYAKMLSGPDPTDFLKIQINSFRLQIPATLSHHVLEVTKKSSSLKFRIIL